MFPLFHSEDRSENKKPGIFMTVADGANLAQLFSLIIGYLYF